MTHTIHNKISIKLQTQSKIMEYLENIEIELQNMIESSNSDSATTLPDIKRYFTNRIIMLKKAKAKYLTKYSTLAEEIKVLFTILINEK